MISNEDAAKFKKEVLTPVLTAAFLPYALIGLGALLLLIVIILVIIIAVRHRTSVSECYKYLAVACDTSSHHWRS